MSLAGLAIRPLAAGDIPEIAAAFAALGWNKPAAQYQRYLREQERGERAALLARLDGRFAGYLTVVWRSGYPPFRAAGIPEIVDFNVLPDLRRRGIGSRLLDAAEELIAARWPLAASLAGIGVGLDPDYGAAQRLYVERGYLPDGRGLAWRGQPVAYGQSVTVDDDLALYFTRELRR
ncbi:MAG TPA: GNAT family N-acetyltransferase [Nitrolancea sp.]|nr:GNAT family N-acetyltransferase [Nitrolancea sp.]